MEQIKQIIAASKNSTDGGVTAVVEVTWKFVVTVNLEKDEIASLDEASLRDAVGSQVDECVGQTSNTGDAIEITNLIEVRDGETDQIIEQSVVEIHQCDDCSSLWEDHELTDIKDASMRTEPGGVIPSGQCPHCAALCYPVSIAEDAEIVFKLKLIGLDINGKSNPKVEITSTLGNDVGELASKEYNFEEGEVEVRQIRCWAKT